ncbi:MAG: sugar phosphate isomerase/epimerase [Candidatus Scalindua sp.]|jgi:L-ribulose-5-phosphate 3-epimerase|nr:sugar phosphate isomerase/epimerase [Candidatus Scalindua sp.]
MSDYLLGIMQGRLTNAPEGEDLDWFPFESWKDEFFLAKDLNFSNIELVVDRRKSKKNPIWTQLGRKSIINTYSTADLIPLACCLNFVIDYSIADKENIYDSVRAIEYSAYIGFRYVVIPLFETSDLENCNIIDFTKNLNALISVAKDNNIQLLLETNLPGQETVDLISQLEGEVGVVYDIGNATQCGHDIGKDLRVLSSLIQHVHIKDKDNNGENVELGSGNVLFKDFFEKLKEIKYTGGYTLETSRGFDAINRAKNNIQFINNFLY